MHIRDYKNKFSGKCIILGNGPSLNKVNIDTLKKNYTFGVNSIFLMTKENGFIPSFYCVEDSKVFEDNLNEISKYKPKVAKILPEKYFEALNSRDDFSGSISIQIDWNFYHTSNKNFAIPRFVDTSLVNPIFYAGQSVTILNLQLAYYLGFTEIILVGMDFFYQRPTDHDQKGNHILSGGDDPNHFHPDYFGKGKTWKDPRLSRVLRSYMYCKYFYESNGRSITNCTEGGHLEIFNRGNLEECLL